VPTASPPAQEIKQEDTESLATELELTEQRPVEDEAVPPAKEDPELTCLSQEASMLPEVNPEEEAKPFTPENPTRRSLIHNLSRRFLGAVRKQEKSETGKEALAAVKAEANDRPTAKANSSATPTMHSELNDEPEVAAIPIPLVIATCDDPICCIGKELSGRLDVVFEADPDAARSAKYAMLSNLFVPDKNYFTMVVNVPAGKTTAWLDAKGEVSGGPSKRWLPYARRGAAAGAVGGGAAGLTTGAVVGGAIGSLGAIFTFGLSIPVGMAIGGGAGLCAGAAGGGGAGFVAGGAVGYRTTGTNNPIDDAVMKAQKKLGKLLDHKKVASINNPQFSIASPRFAASPSFAPLTD